MLKNYPKVSVVTLTYRKFEKLYDTIASVLAQDYGNIEYIICDDGSEAFPYDQVNKYIADNTKSNVTVKILQNLVNVGTVKSFNRAYKESAGKYIINLSCGDVFFTNDVVTKIVKRFEETDANVVVTTRLFYENDYQSLCFLPHYEEREILIKLDTPLKQYKAFILSRYRDMASGSAMYYRADVIKHYNYFDERYRLWEDGPFLAKYLWDDKLEMAYDIVSIWYEKGGVSTNKTKKLSPVQEMLFKDATLFALGEKLKHLDCFTAAEKRLIKCHNKGYTACAQWQLWYLRMKFLPQVYSNLMYRREREKFWKNDLRYIKEVLENNKDKLLPQKLR